MDKITASKVPCGITSKVEIPFYYWSLNLQLRGEESL
jgi:hypothetical protein